MISIVKRYQHILYPLLDFPLNGINYFFLIYASWHLPASDFGAANALLGLLALVMVTGTTLQAVTAKKMAECGQDCNQLVVPRFAVLIFLAILGTGLIFSSAFAEFTHSSRGAVMLLLATLAVHQIVSPLRGFYQGRRQFIFVNGSLYVEICTKLVLALVLLPLAPNYTTVIFCSGAGLVASLVYHWSIARGKLPITIAPTIVQSEFLADKGIALTGSSRRDYVNLLLGNLIAQYFTAIDVILFNYFQPSLGGHYAIVAKYGQLIYYFALSLQIVLLPYLTQYSHRPRVQQRRLLFLLLGGYLFAAIGAVCLYATVVPVTVPMIFHSQYADAQHYLWMTAIAYSLLAILQLLSLLCVVQNRSIHLSILIAIGIVITVGYLIQHHSIPAIMTVQIFTYSAGVIALLVTVWQLIYRKTERKS